MVDDAAVARLLKTGVVPVSEGRELLGHGDSVCVQARILLHAACAELGPERAAALRLGEQLTVQLWRNAAWDIDVLLDDGTVLVAGARTLAGELCEALQRLGWRYRLGSTSTWTPAVRAGAET